MYISSSLMTICLAAWVGDASAASILLRGGTIIAFDNTTSDLEVHRDSSLLIVNDRITAIFPIANPDKVAIPSGTTTIDATGKIISPGFVDTHRHGWQTQFKTIASNTTLSQYFYRYGEFVAFAGYTAADVYSGQLTGNLEALNAGVTSILDHSHATWSDETADAALSGSIDSGARVFHAVALHELPNGYTIAQQIAKIKNMATTGRYRNTPVSLGVAYDRFEAAPRGEVNTVISLAKCVSISLSYHSMRTKANSLHEGKSTLR